MSNGHPLVVRFGAFGDMILITPLLKRLYKRCGLPSDVISSGNWNKYIFQHMPYVRNVYTIPSKRTPYLFSPEKRHLVKTLKAHEYPATWILENNQIAYKLIQRSGQKEVIGAVDFPRGTNEHSANQWLRMGNESTPDFAHPKDFSTELNSELFVTDQEVEECRHWLKSRAIDPESPLICIQAGNKKTMRPGRVNRSSNTKFWHERNWAALIDMIVRHNADANVLLCGVPAEHGMTLNIFNHCMDKTRVHCVADDLPIRRLFALLSIADSCISVDTGPAHAAAALDCNVTVLFAKADARLCAPISTQSQVIQITGRIPGTELLNTPESWSACHDISLIKPEQVFAGWLECSQNLVADRKQA
jgi:ADP-heptose:LPS heptosyltransferase